MESLRPARVAVKASITLLSKYLDTITDKSKLTPEQVLELSIRTSAAELLLPIYYEKHDRVLNEIPDADTQLLADETKKKDDFEELYFRIITRARYLLVPPASKDPSVNPGPSSASSTTSNTSSSNLQQIQLPKINLPSFSGLHDGWLEFRDKYESLIHTNEAIGNMQKYHYLRSCLSGEAAAVIQGIEFSAANYTEAWRILCARYDNPCVLMHNHVKSLFQIETIQRESANKLRALLDNMCKHLNALDRLQKKNNDNLYAVLITFIISSKFDAVTAREWEEKQDPNKLPTVKDLEDFISAKANLLSTLELKRGSTGSTNTNTNKFARTHQGKQTISHVVNNETNFKCVICKNEHYLRNCPQLLQLSPSDRYSKIKSLNRCVNCLRYGHSTNSCTSSNCRRCGKRHHTLLHLESSENSIANSNTPETENNTATINALTSRSNNEISLTSHVHSAPCVLLSTALVNILDKFGRPYIARALLDGGSQSNFISQQLADKLNLKLAPVDITVSGISGSSSSIQFSCRAHITASSTDCELTTNFYVIPVITGSIPPMRIDTSHFKVPANIALADPTYAVPGPIDLLLGAQHFMSLLCIGQISLGKRGPTLQKSKLGWIMSGMAAGIPRNDIYCHLSHELLNNNLTRFWEVEEVPCSASSKWQSNPCEIHFKNTVKRNSVGRFVVSLPLTNIEELGNSRETALKRFFRLERTLKNQPYLREQYNAFINEYISLEHMSLSVKSVDPEYYLPHHAVIKESSSTTKVRVVFDASAKPLQGKALNDCQLNGPTIQSDLFSILIRFRKHSYVVCADIEKMYRQVLIEPSQRSLQKIFWRFNEDEPIQSYELNTVTYGTRSGSFLAIRCLFEIANELDATNPQVAKVIRQDMYVDDFLSGAENPQELISIINDLNFSLKQACFHLRKWISNHPDIIKHVDNENDHSIDISSFDDTPLVR